MSSAPAASGLSSSVLRAVFCALGAISCFASMNAMIKWLGGSYPLSQIVFFRALFALVVLWPLIRRAGGWRSLKTERPLGHILRSLAGVVGMTCGFTGLTMLPLANAAALAFTAPLWTTVLGVVVLGEKVRWRRTLALIAGFTGVLIMLRPDARLLAGMVAGDRIALGSLLSLSGAALAAMAMVTIRHLSSTERNTTIVFYFMVTGVVTGLLLPGSFIMPGLKDGILLAAVGIVGGVAQILMTTAYRGAPVAVIAPFDYMAMLWATLYGFLIWGELPDRWVVVGALIVIGSGLYITLRELKLGGDTTPVNSDPTLT